MTVPIKLTRYEDLVRKEALLETIIKAHGMTTGYAFHDVVGYLIKSDKERTEKADG